MATALGVSLAILPRAVDSLHADGSGYTYNNPNASINNNQITITMGDSYFSPQNITVRPGTTIVWINNGTMQHTVTSDNGLFDSGALNPGQSFSYTFGGMGTFGYHCRFHGNAGGVGMAGYIQVSGQAYPSYNYYNPSTSQLPGNQNCTNTQTPTFNAPSPAPNNAPGISGLSPSNAYQNPNSPYSISGGVSTDSSGRSVGVGPGCVVDATHECLY